MQDAPPKGGFPTTIRYQRHLPKRGPSGAVMIVGLIGVVAWGFQQVGLGNRERRELRREKAWSRIYLVPLLQAEADRDFVRRMDSVAKRESELTKGLEWSSNDLKSPVKGIGKNGYDPDGNEPVYYTKRHVDPTYLIIPKENQIEAQWWRGSKMFTKNPPYQDRSDFTKDHPIGQ